MAHGGVDLPNDAEATLWFGVFPGHEDVFVDGPACNSRCGEDGCRSNDGELLELGFAEGRS